MKSSTVFISPLLPSDVDSGRVWNQSESSLRRGAVTGAAGCGEVRLLGRAALANACGLLRRYWARTQEALQRHPRGIPEAYQRHTRGKPRGKPSFNGKINVKRDFAMKNY